MPPVLMTVNIALRRQLWQLDYYTEGSVPDALIGVPQGWTPDQIRQFRDYWDAEFAGDLAKRRRAKFVPGETAANVTQLWQLDYYTEGSVPDAMIGAPAGWTIGQGLSRQDHRRGVRLAHYA